MKPLLIRTRMVLVLIGAAVVMTAGASGGLASPVLPLVSLWLFLAAWRLPAQASAVAVGASTAALSLIGALDGLSVTDLVRVVTVVLAGAVPAALARGTARHKAATRGGEAELDPPQGLSEPSLRQEVGKMLRELAQQTQSRRVVLWVVEEATATASQFASSDGFASADAVPMQGDPMGWVWRHGISLQLAPPPAWAAPDCAVLAVRIERGNGDIGLITFEFPPGAAIPSLVSFEGPLAQFRGFLDLYDQQTLVWADRQRLELLVSTLRRLPSRIDLAGFSNSLVQDAVRLAGATGGALAVWGRDEGRIVAVVDRDGGPPVGGTFEPLESELALAARGGAMIVRELRGATSKVPIATPADQWKVNPRCLAALPLATPDGVIGVLVVWSTEQPRLEPGALELIRTLAPFAASQLAHAQEYGRIREDADRDALTGLYNRRVFDHTLDAERARHERYGQPFALLLIDVDHFKSINDRFGHEAGDVVLRTVARVVNAGVRDVDLAARFGGEEFAVLLPETLPEAAADVAERLRVAVERTTVPWKGDSIRVRISIGVSSCPACVREPRDLVRSADAALYQAKVLGRNRVIRAPATG